MISMLLERGHSRPSAGALIAWTTMVGYALIASIMAGAASPGAGLGVIALGLFAVTVVDFALWREMMSRDPEATDTAEAPEPAILPPPAALPNMTESSATPNEPDSERT